MPGRNLFVASALTALLFIAANLFVERAAKNSVPRQTMHAIDAAPAVIGVFATGSSLVATGFDPQVFERIFQSAGHPIVAVNGALGATGTIEHLLLVRRALRRHTIHELIYGYVDQQMSNDAPTVNADLFGNRAMLYYEEPQIALRYARFNPLDWIEFQTFRCCAIFRERGTIWARVEKLRRAMGEVGMPHQATNRFGRVEDFDLLEAASPEAFTELCTRAMQSGRMLSPPIQELFEEARAGNVRITVVEMPVPPWHAHHFYDLPAWSEFRQDTRQAVERLGASYIDASRWIPDESQFQDHVHLGPSGGAQFTRLLAERLLTATPSTIASTR